MNIEHATKSVVFYVPKLLILLFLKVVLVFVESNLRSVSAPYKLKLVFERHSYQSLG